MCIRDRYETERGFCIDIRKWGFPISTDNEELKKIIKNFDVHKFKKSIDEHHKVLGSFENGYARKAIMNLIDCLLYTSLPILISSWAPS